MPLNIHQFLWDRPLCVIDTPYVKIISLNIYKSYWNLPQFWKSHWLHQDISRSLEILISGDEQSLKSIKHFFILNWIPSHFLTHGRFFFISVILYWMRASLNKYLWLYRNIFLIRFVVFAEKWEIFTSQLSPSIYNHRDFAIKVSILFYKRILITLWNLTI